MQRQRKEELLDYIINQVNKIPVEDVIGSVVDLIPRGRHLMGLCPFHPDTKIGSFVVTPDKNIWECFTEGIGGNAVKFVMMERDISYLEAVFQLGREYGILSEDEYRRLTRKKWDENNVEQIRKRIEEPKKVFYKKADQDVIACVYSVIPKVCSLSEQHRRHLLKERKLKEESLKDYFTFPTRRMDLAGKVFREISEELSMKKFGKNASELTQEEHAIIANIMKRIADQFPYVPGFYMNKKTNKIDFASYKGIGILARDLNGRPTGIQIRRDTIKEGEQRYVWFSSAFALSQPDKEGGASSGSPGGYLKGGSVVCITEGRFKAEKIAEKGNTAIYVSGVSTWKSIIPIVKELATTKIYLMFDADTLGNVAVHKQLKALADELDKMNVHSNVILWSKSCGKGFDDLVINKGQNYKKFMKCLPFEEFEKTYEKTVTDVLHSFQVDEIKNLPTSDAENFINQLQDEAEARFELKRDV